MASDSQALKLTRVDKGFSLYFVLKALITGEPIDLIKIYESYLNGTFKIDTEIIHKILEQYDTYETYIAFSMSERITKTNKNHIMNKLREVLQYIHDDFDGVWVSWYFNQPKIKLFVLLNKYDVRKPLKKKLLPDDIKEYSVEDVNTYMKKVTEILETIVELNHEHNFSFDDDKDRKKRIAQLNDSYSAKFKTIIHSYLEVRKDKNKVEDANKLKEAMGELLSNYNEMMSNVMNSKLLPNGEELSDKVIQKILVSIKTLKTYVEGTKE